MSSDQSLTLDRVPPGVVCVIDEILNPPAAGGWPQRLEELGFLPGELVTVVARGLPGGDPLAVRVGQSRFALRRGEAACVQVRHLKAVP
jgi:ferrous iron transport protein A